MLIFLEDERRAVEVDDQLGPIMRVIAKQDLVVGPVEEVASIPMVSAEIITYQEKWPRDYVWVVLNDVTLKKGEPLAGDGATTIPTGMAVVYRRVSGEGAAAL